MLTVQIYFDILVTISTSLLHLFWIFFVCGFGRNGRPKVAWEERQTDKKKLSPFIAI